MISSYDPDDFDPIKTLNKMIRFALVTLCVIIALIYSCSCSGQSKSEYVDLISGHGIQHAEVVYAQMMLESGNLECVNCSWSEHNNPFGFHNGKRYLHYDNLEHALQGYYEWQQWRCPDCETKEEYYNCLIKHWGAFDMIGYVEKLEEI